MAAKGDLGEFFIGLDVDLSSLQASLKQAASQLNEAANKMTNDVEKMANTAEAKFKKLVSSIEGVGRKMTEVGKAISTIGVPLGLAAGAAIKMGMEAVESENLFEVSMGSMAGQAREFSEELRKQFGLNSYSVRNMMGTFNVMVDSMGVGTQNAYGMAKGLTQLTYDIASFYNLRPDEAFQKLQSGISGEIEPLKRLGIIVTEDMVKQRGLTDGIIKQGQELSVAQKAVIRYNLIMELTKKAQGDLARTIDSPTNRLRIQTEQFKQNATDLGIALLPALNMLLGITKPLVTAIGALVQWFSKLSEPIRTIAGAIIGLIAIAGPLLIVAGKITEAFSKVLPVLSKLWTVLTTQVIPAVVSFQVAIGPIGWAIEAVILIIVALWLAWKNNFGNIREHFENFKKGIIDAIKAWIDSIKTMFGGLGKIFQGIWSILSGRFKEGWDQIKEGGKDVASGYVGQWKAAFSAVGTAAKEGAGFIVDGAKDAKKELDKLLKPGATPAAVPGLTGVPEIPYPTGVSAAGLPSLTLPGGGDKATMDAFEKAKRLYDMDVIQFGITTDQKLKLYKEYLATVDKTDDERFEYEKQLKEFSVQLKEEEIEQKKKADEAYESYVSGITSRITGLFRQGLDAMLAGTLTFQGAVNAVWTELQNMFLDVITQMFESWLKAEIAKRAQALITTLVMQAQGKSALGALAAVLGAAATSLIGAVTVVGTTVLGMMGAIGAALLAIPGVGFIVGGLIIAGVAAAIVKISQLASGANKATTEAVPSFAVGSMEIGQSGLAMVHAGETILPARSAEKFRESAGGLGAPQINVNMPIEATDAKSFENRVIDIMPKVTSEIRKQMRLGKA